MGKDWSLIYHLRSKLELTKLILFQPKCLENYADPLSWVPQRNTTHDVLIQLVAPGLFCSLLCYMVISDFIKPLLPVFVYELNGKLLLSFDFSAFCAKSLSILKTNLALLFKSKVNMFVILT